MSYSTTTKECSAGRLFDGGDRVSGRKSTVGHAPRRNGNELGDAHRMNRSALARNQEEIVHRWNETKRRSYSAVKVAEAVGNQLLRAPMERSWDLPVGGRGHRKVVIDRVKLIGGKRQVRSNER
jgi:hypothetical protein